MLRGHLLQLIETATNRAEVLSPTPLHRIDPSIALTLPHPAITLIRFDMLGSEEFRTVYDYISP